MIAPPAGRLRHRVWWLAAAVAAGLMAVVAVYVINPFGTAAWDVRARLLGYMVYRMPSVSMAPTLAPGDVIMVDTKRYSSAAPAHGDVIVFFPPAGYGDSPFIARVVAVGGESVAMREGALFVDGKAQPMPPGALPAIGPGRGRDLSPQPIPAGHVFVLGDNRDHSLDSRYYGPVPGDQLVGRMVGVMDVMAGR